MVITKKISKILVAIDGSETSNAAAYYGIDLASKMNADLNIINVIFTPKSMLSVRGESSFREFLKASKNDAQKWFDKIRMVAEEKKIQIKAETIEEINSVADAIINYAKEKEIDLIVIGTRGLSGFKKLLLGSVASQVSTYAECPVLIVK